MPRKGTTMREEQVLLYLKSVCRGRKNIRKSHEIEKALNISGNELRKHINRLRRKGMPIASSQDGYFFAVTAGEVYLTIRQLRTMTQGLLSAIEGLESSLDSFGGEAH